MAKLSLSSTAIPVNKPRYPVSHSSIKIPRFLTTHERWTLDKFITQNANYVMTKTKNKIRYLPTYNSQSMSFTLLWLL
jgi:hypothetical protein